MEIGRKVLAGLFLTSGLLHFILKPAYLNIMPSYLPRPELLIEISGLCEFLGGLGLLVAPVRRAAAWGLVALLVAVVPANINMAMNHSHWPVIPVWVLWARVPLQAPLLWWTWLYTRDLTSKIQSPLSKRISPLETPAVEIEDDRGRKQTVHSK